MVNMLCKSLKNKGNILGVGLTGSWAVSPIDCDSETNWLVIGTPYLRKQIAVEKQQEKALPAWA